MIPTINHQEIIRIARARMQKSGIPVPTQRDIDAHISRIIFLGREQTQKQIANRLVEDCRSDYITLTARFSHEIKGTKKRKTVRVRGMYWLDYLAVQAVESES